MKDYSYVDENFQILQGEDARRALEITSDKDNLSEGRGIPKVSRNRWQIAQTFERNGWMREWARVDDDRNYQHMAGFENYQTLGEMTFENAIELGCGPFTNLRLIGTKCSIKTCTLLDPLIEDYLRHRYCSFNRQELRCGYNSLHRALGYSKPLRGLRRVIRQLAPRLLAVKTLPVHSLIASPIEDMPIQRQFDLIVMINVIEHCMDIERILENILKIAAPNALFVYHDKYYDHQVVAQMVQGHHYDAGHPLMVDHSVIDEFLGKHFQTLFRKIAHDPSDVGSATPEYERLFFIGKRLSDISTV